MGRCRAREHSIYSSHVTAAFEKAGLLVRGGFPTIATVFVARCAMDVAREE